MSACSLVEDMTPYLVHGDMSLRYLYLSARDLATPEELGSEDFARKLEMTFRYLVVALTSCAFNLAWARENVRPNPGHDAGNRARQDMILNTFSGLRCMCGSIHKPAQIELCDGESFEYIWKGRCHHSYTRSRHRKMKKRKEKEKGGEGSLACDVVDLLRQRE